MPIVRRCIHTQADQSLLKGNAFQADQYDSPLADRRISMALNMRGGARMPDAILAARPASCPHRIFSVHRFSHHLVGS